jgi:hypothetical protein
LAALALLYFWLSGNWFARVIVWLALGAVCGVAFAEYVLTALQAGYSPALATVLLCSGWAIAWPISGIPINLKRRHARQDSAVRAMIV